MKDDIYSFNLVKQDNTLLPFSNYKNKVVLVLLSAIHSTFTPLYFNLEDIYKRYKKDGFEILDFPTDDFSSQCPEDDAFINEYLEKNYKTTFLRLKKIHVINSNIDPFISYLVKKKKFNGFDKGNQMTPVLTLKCLKQNINYEKDASIKWNFTMFLISKNGKVKRRFECTSSLEKIEKAISTLLDEQDYLFNN